MAGPGHRPGRRRSRVFLWTSQPRLCWRAPPAQREAWPRPRSGPLAARERPRRVPASARARTLGALHGADGLAPSCRLLPPPQGQFVEVGLITKAFGIRGEVKVNPSTDEPRKRFAKGKRCALPPLGGVCGCHAPKLCATGSSVYVCDAAGGLGAERRATL